MCKIIKDNKYYILIAILISLLLICIYVIFSNLQTEKIAVENIVNSFTSFFIGLITIIGITFNLRDNEKLRNETKDMKIKEQNKIDTKNKNIRLLISHEVLNNLNNLKEYNSKINMEDKSILMPPECSDTTWKSLYAHLPEAFGECELGFLIKFYEKIEELLDDDSWLKFNNAKPIGAFENIRMEIDGFTEQDLEEAKNHKKFIKKIITDALSLERHLYFLKFDF